MIVKLDYPLKKPGLMGDTIIEQVELRMPTVKDLRGLSFAPPHDQTAFALLVSRVSGLPMPLLDKMVITDYQTVCEALHRMCGWGRK